MCPPAIGAQEFFATLTEVMAGEGCAAGRKPSFLPAGRPSFFCFTKTTPAGRRGAPPPPRAGFLTPLPSQPPPPPPADAPRVFLDLTSRWMVPMHYGTFRFSHEPMDEPLQLLDQEARAAGIQDRVLVLSEGVTQIFDKS